MGGVGSSFEMSSLQSLTKKAAFGKNLTAMKSIQIIWEKTVPVRANSIANAKTVKEHIGPCYVSGVSEKDNWNTWDHKGNKGQDCRALYVRW